MFVSDNKIRVVNTPTNTGKEFSILPLLMKHKVISTDAELNNQFDRLGLKPVRRDHQIRSSEDSFFRDMLSAKLPFF